MSDYLYRGSRSARRPALFGYLGAGAATVSIQSVCEKAFGLAFAAATGARDFGIGCLAFSDVGSPVQLVIDRELVGIVEHLLRDVNIDEDHLGVDTILQTVPQGGRYVETDHTAQFFREECWLPGLLDYRAFMAWASHPADMIADARGKARKLYAAATNHSPLSDAQQRDIRRLMTEPDAVAGTHRKN